MNPAIHFNKMLRIIDYKFDPLTHGEMNDEFEKEYFNSATGFKWDDFQLHSFQAIKKDNNLLVVAPTSSGKTAVAKYATIYNLVKGHRVVYTTPIKSLSNEKYEEMREVLAPLGIQPGLITGDQKINVDSKFLIMTAEILCNALFMLKDNKQQRKNQYELDKDFISTIGCVIIDEVHFISDRSRGHIWEKTLVLLDPKIQIIKLSATIDSPGEFAEWIGRIKNHDITLVLKYDRPVPLEYAIYDGSNVITIMNDEIGYDDIAFQTALKSIDKMDAMHKKNKTNKVTNSINNFITYSKKNNLLQLCFIVFSKKNCEKFAESVNVNLINGKDSALAIRALESKMGIYLKDYVTMPRYMQMRALIEKGIGFHHAGIPVILKEVVEYLFKTGHIKVIFATETIAIGVNMPIRTLVLTSFEKSEESSTRTLNAAEFKQICGRAGRRGLDKKGLIVFLPLYDLPSEAFIKTNLLFGPMPKIESRMNIDYHSFLKLLQTKVTDADTFFNNSLLKIQNSRIAKNYDKEITDLEKQYEDIQTNIKKYIDSHAIGQDILTNIKSYVDSKTIQNQQNIGFVIKPNKQQIAKTKAIEAIAKTHNELSELTINSAKIKQDLDKKLSEKQNIDEYKSSRYSLIGTFLRTMGYISESDTITEYGMMASLINECNPFILTEIFTGNILQSLNPKQIICFLSILTDEITRTNKIEQSLKSIKIDPIIKDAIQYIESRVCEYIDTEAQLTIFSEPGYWNLSYDYLDLANLWASMDLAHEDHSRILSQLALMEEYEGSFIKNMLKINNIVGNLMSLCELAQNFDLMPVLQEIEPLILKGMVNVNSIHVQS